MENYVITIARSYGSDGCAIAELLAKRLNIRFLDKELISLVSVETGISEELLEKSDERVSLGLLDLARDRKYYPEFERVERYDEISEHSLFRYQAETIRKLAQRESFVVVGRAADYVLSGFERVFSVNIQAPFEDCVEGIMKRKFVDAKTAVKDIRRINRERVLFYKAYTGKDWNDPLNYDLCVNSSSFSEEACISLIRDGACLKFGFEI